MNWIRSLVAAILAAGIPFSGNSPTRLAAQENGKPQELWLQFEGENGPGTGKHVVLISGDDEYRSEEALPMLAKILANRFGFRCSVLFPINDEGIIQPDFQTNIPGMELLESADAVVLGLRFRDLPDRDMEKFARYVESGKPIIALRTSTHAFRIPSDRPFYRYSWDSKVEGWEGGFGKRVLGETWVNHHGRHGKQSTRGVANRDHDRHPILRGVDDVWGPTDVYGVGELPDDATVLLYGQVLQGMRSDDKAVQGKVNDPMMPIAWTRAYVTESGARARVFCTTMGAATDFRTEDVRRLLINAVLWAVEKEDDIRPELSVDTVDDYRPTDFGFGSYQKNRRPADHGLKVPAPSTQ